MYQHCVGKGGMSPEYFRTKLTFSEARDFLTGLAMRDRAGWEYARLIADVTARCAGNKNGIGLAFPWDDDAPDFSAPDEKEMEDLLKIKDSITWD